MRAMIVSLAIWLLPAANAFATNTQTDHQNEIQVWHDGQGLISESFCESNDMPLTPDAKISSYAESRLSDGTVVQMVEENGAPASVSCLSGHQRADYFLLRFTKNAETRVIAVNASETLLFSSPAQIWTNPPALASAAATKVPAGIEVQEGMLDLVVCVSSAALNVRDQSLTKVLFTAPRFSSVKVVQSFGTDRFKKNIGGVEYAFVKAEFGASKVGWVAEKYLINRAQCPGASPNAPTAPVLTQSWTFPTWLRPVASYKEGMRKFRAGRSNGRLHAACDLYRVKDEKVLSVSAGKVIRDKYYFYQGTYAIEVKHTGGKVARYGEVTGKQAPGLKLNTSVSSGQVVGYVGKVNSGCCTPMLHFELYSGTATGALSQSGNAFQRRKDLIDPTNLLSGWEKAKFGISY